MSSRHIEPSLIRGGAVAALLFLTASCGPDGQNPLATAPDGPELQAGIATQATVSVFASGLTNPRGLRFSPDGNLYVGEAGVGGTYSTEGRCPQVTPVVGPNTGGLTARIVKIDPQGQVTTVAANLPSTVDPSGASLGVADLIFENHRLYALLAGAGCAHGHPEIPASIIQVNADGSWAVVANLSRYTKTHPSANTAPDFDPEGVWYSLTKFHGDLVAQEANHGELARINLKTGVVSRISDLSATQGHIVPTAVTADRSNFFVGNLNAFPIVPGSSKILKVTPGGAISDYATGFTTIVSVVMDPRGRMYVLEMSAAPGFPTPFAGRIVRVSLKGQKEVVVGGLFFPTGMTMGPDGNLYVSNHGFGPPGGEILKVTLP